MNKFFLIVSLCTSVWSMASVASIRFELSVYIKNGEDHQQVQDVQLINDLNEAYVGKFEKEDGIINYTISTLKNSEDRVKIEMEVVRKEQVGDSVTHTTIAKPVFIARFGDSAWVRLGNRSDKKEENREMLIVVKAIKE